MANLVRFRVSDGVAVVTLDAPPVNALSKGVRAGLWEAIGRINVSAEIHGAVIVAAGRMFSAGADIREFGATAQEPSLPQVCDRIEGCIKPVVAAIHGRALGGGAEIALAAHYRIATPDAQIGLPEIALGLLPGAGGTQRLPRLIGSERALHLMLTANTVDGAAARAFGLVDRVSDGDLTRHALAFAQEVIDAGKGPRRTRDMRQYFADGRAYRATVAKARAGLKNTALHAPHRVLDCVEAANVLPFEAGQAFEADAFQRCLDHPQSVALRHVFVAERKIDDALVAQVDGTFKPVEPMGKSTVHRLRQAMRAAANYLAENGSDTAEIDGALVAYGFRRGPFGGNEHGVERPEITRRVIAALVVEGAACVDQGAVQRPSDIDILAVHGLGFPRRKGGPFRDAQTLGLIGLRTNMRDWAQDSDLWAVPDLLDAAIKDVRGFDSLPQ